MLLKSEHLKKKTVNIIYFSLLYKSIFRIYI